eukprot:PhF_6_TR3725/c0_g1_i2/m.5336
MCWRDPTFIQQQYGNTITIVAEGTRYAEYMSFLISLSVSCNDWVPQKPYGGTNITNPIDCNTYPTSMWNTTTKACQTKCEWFTMYECTYTYGKEYCIWNTTLRQCIHHENQSHPALPTALKKPCVNLTVDTERSVTLVSSEYNWKSCTMSITLYQ